jgi:transposase InsO family protein
VEALQDMSRRPQRVVNATDGETVLRIIEARHAHPRFGPKKLRVLLVRMKCREVPTVRTIARVLLRAGEPLVRPRRRRDDPLGVVRDAPVTKPAKPNALWTVDFKGWWRTRDGRRCEPLTVRDGFSRFVLCALLLASTKWQAVKKSFEGLFVQNGLPDAIQVDNGPPFASTKARCGLTRLSAWWVSLGIRVIRSRPGCPQDNGGHERMHGDIALDVEASRAQDPELQQRRLNRWREEFNQIRPHEALDMKVPAELYHRSNRRYLGPLSPCYPAGVFLRRVSTQGHVRVDGKVIFVGSGLAQHDVGLERSANDSIRIRYYDLLLGEFMLANGRWIESRGPQAPEERAS